MGWGGGELSEVGSGAAELRETRTEPRLLRASLAPSQDNTWGQLLPNNFHYMGSISLDKRSKQWWRGGFTVLLPPGLQ